MEERTLSCTDADAVDLEILRYLLADKSRLYRAVMRVFMEARARYQLHRRPAEVVAALKCHGYPLTPEEEEGIESTLEALVAWGNLTRTQQTSGARTLEEWRQRRFLYQITTRGERAEYHIGQLIDALVDQGALQRVMLRAVLDNLQALAVEAASPAPDADKLYRLLIDLRAQFNSLTENASAFLISVSRALDATTLDSTAFHAYKLPVLAYIENFVEELTRLAPPIVRCLEEVQAGDPERLFLVAASANDVPQLDGTVRDETDAFRTQWQGLRGWFIGAPGQPANAEALKDEARAAVNRMLAILGRLAESRSGRVSRRADLISLAKRFEGLPDDEDAHRLFKVAFGLFGARHLAVVNEDEELDESRLELPRESWWASKPVDVPVRLRESGPYSRVGRVAPVEDLSLNKRHLAAQADEARLRREAALASLADRGLIKVSELRQLEIEPFQALVDLLAFTMVKPRRRGEVTVGRSRDGRLEILIAWPTDGAWATVETRIGRLHLPDYQFEIAVRSRSAAVGERVLA